MRPPRRNPAATDVDRRTTYLEIARAQRRFASHARKKAWSTTIGGEKRAARTKNTYNSSQVRMIIYRERKGSTEAKPR